ncbi:spherulation-specific family 4 protein [Acrocarpospora phusangensis]|nr:spherulation-specific family 4 protein [Acrocarpospora phusangensis]
MLLLRVIASFVLLSPPVPSTEVGQLLGVPAYFAPATWGRLSGPGIAVANPVSGPGRTVDAELAQAMRAAHERGVTVLGYVTTGYLGRTGRVTRFGETGRAAWLAQTQQEIAAWYRLYGEHGLTGVFLDEVADDCASADGYRDLRAFTRRYDPAARLAANPGTGVPECFSDVADVLVSFEGDLETYRGWQPPQWQLTQDPRRFWHLVHDAPAPAEAMNLGKQRNAGYMYVTPDVLANPWDTLPGDDYLAAEKQAAQATDTVPPSRPGQPEAVRRDLVSLSLRWSASPDAVAYEVYVDGQHVTGTLGATPAVELAQLRSGRPYEIRVRARDHAGNLSHFSPPARLSTLPCPGVRPAPPEDLAAAQIRPSGLRLSWTASPGAHAYDVYRDGRLISTTPGTALAVGALSPATPYTFTVVARNDAGGASGPDLTVTTATAGSAPITDPAGEIGPDSVVYSVRYGTAFDVHQVLLDLDGDETTGLPVLGLGADHLVESGWLFRHQGPAWAWTPVAPVDLDVSDDLHVWRVPKSAHPAISAHRAVFRGATPDSYSEVITVE